MIENWVHMLNLHQLGSRVSVFGLVILFVYFLTLLMGKSLSHLGHFFSKAFKAEFTEFRGWLDLVMFFLFCVFVYVPPIEQDVAEALKLARLNSETQLVNPNLKLLSTLIAFLASLVFVGLQSESHSKRKHSRK